MPRPGSEMEETPSESVVVDATADFGRQQEQRRVRGICCSTVVVLATCILRERANAH
jgi:hypothetical protein